VASKTGVVQVSGRGINVDFTIDDSAPFDDVAQKLRQYLVENRGLWSSGTINVNAGRWMLSRDQLNRIKQVIETESGLTVNRFWCSPDNLDAAKCDVNGTGTAGSTSVAAFREPSNPKRAEVAQGPFSTRPKLKEPKSGGSRKGLPAEALFIKATFRSGESISYPGDVVVLADVNPGAEIVAEGDIVVFGSLQGLVHAGAAGDTKATIIALELNSPRIQIGPYTGLAPTEFSGSKTKGTVPQIAYVRRRSIHVAPYAGRYAKYGRGLLYEG
jgi:septum site-determining protein MinC